AAGDDLGSGLLRFGERSRGLLGLRAHLGRITCRALSSAVIVAGVRPILALSAEILTAGFAGTSSLRNLNTWPRPPSLCLESTTRASTRLAMSVRVAPACTESSRYGSTGVLSLTGIWEPIEVVLVKTRDIAVPEPRMSPVSS